MLQNFGVSDVKIHEVVSLEKEILDALPRPVYGLIFLSKWREENPDKQEQSCPDGVWFANQTVDNACASVALLNIVNNVPGIKLGDNLQAFKDFTQDFSPALRGSTIAEFQFVREVHNSFARKMDMLNADLQLSREFTSKKKDRSTGANEDESTGSFHFIAFVPIEGHVWKLDGLERQPQKLGIIEEEEDWIYQTKPQIEARMAEYEEGQIEFSILSLVKAPLSGLVSALAENVKSLCVLSDHVEAMQRGLKDSVASSRNEFATGLGSLVSRPDPVYGLTQDLIDHAEPLPSVQDAIHNRAELKVLQLWKDLIVGQAGLRTSIREEQLSDCSDQERAASRRFDYGPSVHNVVQLLAKKQFFTTKTLNV